jgi:hypothetical protein
MKGKDRFIGISAITIHYLLRILKSKNNSSCVALESQFVNSSSGELNKKNGNPLPYSVLVRLDVDKQANFNVVLFSTTAFVKSRKIVLLHKQN